jgi:hypothetical protein
VVVVGGRDARRVVIDLVLGGYLSRV